MKKTMKKITAIAMMGLLGATAASAVTLDDYPSMFIEDGIFNGKIVIGEQAQTIDTIAAIDLAAQLQADAVTEAATRGSLHLRSGEIIDDIGLNRYVPAQTIDKADIDSFMEGQTRFDGQTIDYEDVLEIGSTALQTKTSIVDDELGNKIVLAANQESINYRVYFNDEVDTTKIGTTTGKDALEFDFLGEGLKIVGYEGTTITVESANETFMREGQTISVKGEPVTLIAVSDDAVIIEAAGRTEIIREDSKKRFTDKLEIEVENVFHRSDGTGNGATLKFGDRITKTVRNGDAFAFFNEPADKREAEWVWNFDMSATRQYIGITNNMERLELDATSSRDRPALEIGEFMSLPNDYAKILFYGLEERQDQLELEIEVKSNIDLDDGDQRFQNLKGVEFSTDSSREYFLVDSNIKTSKVWVVDNAGEMQVWYADNDEEVKATTTSFFIRPDKDLIEITPPQNISIALNDLENASQAFTIDFGEDKLWLFADIHNRHFGLSTSDEALELQYEAQGNFSNSTGIGSKDYDIITDYGVLIEEPEDQLGGRSIELRLPQNRQTSTVIITNDEQGLTSGSRTYTVNSIPVGMGILDTDAIDSIGNYPMLVVGGPAVNKIAAALMGNPSAEELEGMFTTDLAKIIMYNDKMAVLVAGYEGRDTWAAARVLANYKEHDLTGEEVEIIVNDLDDVEVRRPTL